MPSPGYNFSQITFLIVDDCKGLCSLVRDSLLCFGARDVLIAMTSAEALALLKRPEIDVAMIDYQLGEKDSLNGFDVVRAARRYSDPIRRRPILFFTAFADKETVLTAKQAGVNAMLAKPFSLTGLYTKMIFMLSRPRPFVVTKEYVGPEWD